MTSHDNAALANEVVIIRPSRGLVDIDFKALWRFRDLLHAFAVRDIRLRYRQTALGATWVVLQPLLSALIFAVVFGFIAKMPSQGVPYFLIAFSGMMGWTLFMGNLTRVTPSLVANATLIRKIYFPRLLIPLGVVPSVLVDFAVSLCVMMVLLVLYHVVPGAGLVLFPICILSILLLSLGLGLIGASLSVKYRDIQHIVPFVTQLLMYASPVGYSIAAVPARIRPYYLLNPLAEPIDVIRWSFLGVGQPNFAYLGYAFAASALIMWLGLIVFRSCEREFADVI
ncbi:MAG TPA: ABC transporter permease [Rhizomicrobium sp.]|jgi:lipopolysaccharide transport system permease protein|nr:ABC transporter permease [Rhizomicrobium sp.]